jgi:uncharacterized protein YoaH (UPF0181 family)
MIRMQGKGAVHIMHAKGSYRPDTDGVITVPPELEKTLTDLGFRRILAEDVQTSAGAVSANLPPELAPGPERDRALARSAKIDSLVAGGLTQGEALALVDAHPDQIAALAAAKELENNEGDLVSNDGNATDNATLVETGATVELSDTDRQAAEDLVTELVAGGMPEAEARALVSDQAKS